jgi:hypothetical protein
LIGTFTSDGSALSAWNFTDLIGHTWNNSNPDQQPLFNDQFAIQLGENITSNFFALVWSTQEVSASSPFSNGTQNGTFVFTPASPVPEPSVGVLLLAGLVVLAGYRWRQQRQAGMQVG